MTSSLSLVMVTAPNKQEGARIAKRLVEERLAGCVNIIGGVRSIYRWEGEICDEQEVILYIKTRAELLGRLKALVESLHPYEVPEIISFEIAAGSEGYLSWVREETLSPP